MVKLAHVATVDLGLRYLLLNQLRSVRAAGFDVVGISSPGENTAAVEAAGIRHIPVTMTRRAITPLQDLVALWHLVRVFRRERFAIVHTHNPKPGLLGQIAARIAGVPIVVNTLHGFYFHDGTPPLTRRIYIALERIAARCSDVILSQNQEDIQTAIREGICAPGKIKHLGNGIDIRRFSRANVDPDLVAEKRGELGIAPHARVVGFVGRLVAEKGLPELLEAVNLVREHIPDVRLLIVGPIDYDKADAIGPELAERSGVADLCIFAGLRQDMPDLYAMMNVFALPSHREGFPRAPMEASAMGVPCVVTDIRGCREAVYPERNGILVPLRDSVRLAHALIELLGDKNRADRMGTEGRRMAEEQFDEEIVFSKVTSEYVRLLGQKGLPAPDVTLANSLEYAPR